MKPWVRRTIGVVALSISASTIGITVVSATTEVNDQALPPAVVIMNGRSTHDAGTSKIDIRPGFAEHGRAGTVQHSDSGVADSAAGPAGQTTNQDRSLNRVAGNRAGQLAVVLGTGLFVITTGALSLLRRYHARRRSG